jgi:concanavalin A-like lectin/glucanase superfamily protein
VHLALDGALGEDASQQATPRGLDWVPGVYDEALRTHGLSVLVKRPLPDRGTLCLWYKPNWWYDYQTIFDTPADPNGWEMWIYATGELRFRAHPQGTVLSHRFHPTGDAREWHHLALTWDRADDGPEALGLYVNGRLAQAAPWSDRGWFKAGASFSLGGGNRGNTPGTGTLDEVVLFDVPLSPTEVRFVMNAPALK